MVRRMGSISSSSRRRPVSWAQRRTSSRVTSMGSLRFQGQVGVGVAGPGVLGPVPAAHRRRRSWRRCRCRTGARGWPAPGPAARPRPWPGRAVPSCRPPRRRRSGCGRRSRPAGPATASAATPPRSPAGSGTGPAPGHPRRPAPARPGSPWMRSFTAVFRPEKLQLALPSRNLGGVKGAGRAARLAAAGVHDRAAGVAQVQHPGGLVEGLPGGVVPGLLQQLAGGSSPGPGTGGCGRRRPAGPGRGRAGPGRRSGPRSGAPGGGAPPPRGCPGARPWPCWRRRWRAASPPGPGPG